MLGVPLLLPVRPIARYETRLDEQMAPVAEVPAQDIAPWREALSRLLKDRPHYEEISRQSRRAALEYASDLDAGHFEKLLSGPRKCALQAPPARPTLETLSPEKRKLLALRLRKQSLPAAWFPNAGTSQAPRLFCFPHAGGGAMQPPTPSGWAAVPVRLPGRARPPAPSLFPPPPRGGGAQPPATSLRLGRRPRPSAGARSAPRRSALRTH